MPSATNLSGRHVLVVEDDFYLANDADRALRAAGASIVGPLPRSALALDALAQDGIDAAVVDINLGEGPSFELADALKAAGVPFVFVTGYDEVQIPARFSDVTAVQKPADARAVVTAVAALLRQEA